MLITGGEGMNVKELTILICIVIMLISEILTIIFFVIVNKKK